MKRAHGRHAELDWLAPTFGSTSLSRLASKWGRHETAVRLYLNGDADPHGFRWNAKRLCDFVFGFIQNAIDLWRSLERLINLVGLVRCGQILWKDAQSISQNLKKAISRFVSGVFITIYLISASLTFLRQCLLGHSQRNANSADICGDYIGFSHNSSPTITNVYIILNNITTHLCKWK